MVLVVLGIDALDPELVDEEEHPNLVLDDHRPMHTIASHTGDPSTHELWPTIITGLPPEEHGLTLQNDGVAWGSQVLEFGSTVADYLLPDSFQSRIGAWLLTNTSADAFRTSASYYTDNGLSTIFDGREAVAIGVPNYVQNPGNEDREHSLRRNLGSMFERDPEATGGHTSTDPYKFYERCMEMAMVRISRARRGLRGNRHELVFAYTSGLDLIGHVTYDLPDLQRGAYDELNEFVGELREDLGEADELLLVSDHGLQDGLHTDEAMVASTSSKIAEKIESVLDVREAIEAELERRDHSSDVRATTLEGGDGVEQQLEDLGYL